jgi:hypothetical protein
LFEFGPAVPMDEVEGTFRLALLAVETLYGSDRVTIEAVYRVDVAARTIEVDRSTDAGATLTLIFAGYARREYGTGSVKLKRTEGVKP